MPQEAFRAAAAPLFAAGAVDALEWSFDIGWDAPLPIWLDALLAHYGAAGRLFGHGVHYSPLSAAWEARQTRWLDALTSEVSRRAYLHVSEHYGFMTAAPFERGAPLPLPRSEATLRVGRDRLRRLRARLSCPLGLENLALAWNRSEALAHGAFLDALLEDSDDFVVLDVHNLYCQQENFDIPGDQLLASFPLERVRELHVSGGSWQSAWPDRPDQQVRCDTHDAGVPEAVFALLRAALEVCPNVRVVVFERLGTTISSERDAEEVCADFQRMRAIVQQESTAANAGRSRGEAAMADTGATQKEACAPSPQLHEHALARFQSALLSLLAEPELGESALRRKFADDDAFGPFRAELASFDGRALGMASRVVKKWARPRTR